MSVSTNFSRMNEYSNHRDQKMSATKHHPPSDQIINNSTTGKLNRTPGLLLGPYYPVAPPDPCNAELWRGNSLPANARAMRLEGRVKNVRGKIVEGALIEIWHADPNGYYPHPSDANHKHVMRNFVGYGVAHSDAQGGFAFHSLTPGSYRDGSIERAPHIHIQVTGRVDRLATQIFFPNHPLNTADRCYLAVTNPHRLLADITRDETDAICLDMTLVLNNG
jgi:protocatechuate 3,4-dioxygenase, beta subunit